MAALRQHNTRHATRAAARARHRTASSSTPASNVPAEDDEDSPDAAAAPSPAAPPSPPAAAQTGEDMYDAFQAWALKTYGDSAKTKTVTKKKYARILKILKGEEQTSAENSKFRFWVKAKGFKLGPIDDAPKPGKKNEQVLFVPCTKIKKGSDGETTVYKRVAVVENFYEIIYDVHVEMDGRGGKHAGQKRTYKAIAELYAFLPREAVTHFLMSCADCQKRMHLSNGVASCQGNGGGGASSATSASSPDSSREGEEAGGASAPAPTPPAAGGGGSALPVEQLDFSVPITTAYLKHMRSLGLSDEEALNPKEESTLGSDELSDDAAPPHYDDDKKHEPAADSQRGDGSGSLLGRAKATDRAATSEKPPPEQSEDATMADDDEAQEAETPIDMSGSSTAGDGEEVGVTTSTAGGTTGRGLASWDQQPLNMTARGSATQLQGDHSYDRALSPTVSGTTALQAGEHTPDDMSASTKEEDEEDDDDDQDKLDINTYDPERLKAFNMFVRLFVDENLDRMVPISRQPKEKIQAIIDSCARQFPEFSERARKRIRTYLKSCRRTKRTREMNGWDGRTAVPHLTSPLAEQILASACESETNNAKRMRLGLQPLSTDMDVSTRSSTPSFLQPSPTNHHPSPATTSTTNCKRESTSFDSLNVSSQLISRLTAPLTTANPSTTTPSVLASNDVTTVCPFHLHHHHHHHGTPNGTTSSTPTIVTASPITTMVNGATGHHHHHHGCYTNGNGHLHHHHHNGGNNPTDLSVKKCSGVGTPLKYSLSSNEVNAVRQLIAGYRESAAFLLRSADELEQLLLQQN